VNARLRVCLASICGQLAHPLRLLLQGMNADGRTEELF